MDQTSDTNSVSWRFFTAVCGLGLAALLAWDGLGLDMALAAPWGGPGGFALRDDWWLSKIMHEGARALAWLVFLALAAGIWRPWGVLASLPLNARVRLFLSVLAALLSVTLLKGLSHTSCPWDLQAFGGSAAYVSHWALGQRDGGGGHCFPAGHASAGFAFVGDVVIAEPKALIGFAGPRVIESTVRVTLPEGFQRAEFLLEKGAIDFICDRRELKMTIANTLAMLTRQSADAVS